MPRKDPKRPHPRTVAPDPLEERLQTLSENPERLLGRLVSVIARCGPAYAGRMLARLGLSPGQAIVLAELYRLDGCSQEELRLIVKLDKGNVTRALQRLEKHGFVRRQQDPQDKRVIRVYVTPAALAARRELFTAALRWDDELAKGLTPEERDTAVRLLTRIQANAEAMARAAMEEHEIPGGGEEE